MHQQSRWWKTLLSACIALTAGAAGGVLATPASAAPLPDARGYEMASPIDKNGGDIVGDGMTIVASEDGDGVAFTSRTTFGDVLGSGALGQTQFLARRGVGGWATHGITPASDRGALQALFGLTVIPVFASDLRRAMVWAYDLPSVGDDTAHAANLYVEDTTSRSLESVTVSRADPLNPFEFITIVPWGSSRDVQHISFVSASRLLPEAPAGVPSVYEWSGGMLKLASILPDGTVPGAGGTILPEGYRQAMSADGSRLAFVSPPSGDPQLYLRSNGSRTAWISQSEATISVPTPSDVLLQAMTDEGRHILFTTTSQLLDEDTNDGPDLYMYTESANPASDRNLTLISASNTVAGSIVGRQNGTAVAGMATDASRIYFESDGSNLWVWDDGNVTLASPNVPRAIGDPGTQMGATASQPGASRVASEGEYIAFLTAGAPAFTEPFAGAATNGHVEMYLYDQVRHTVACCSCPERGVANADVAFRPQATNGAPEFGLPTTRPRFLTADGTKVFFSTAEALVPQDTNGVADVYEYNASSGRRLLISSGQGDSGAWFGDASADGHDVFFVTRQRLVRSDQDALVDLYDARVGGGFPELPPSPVPCQGDHCQAEPTPAPGEPQVGNLAFEESKKRGHHAKAVLGVARSRSSVGSAMRLGVNILPEGGVLSWRGRGIRPVTHKFVDDDAVRVKVALRAQAKTRLKQEHVYRTEVRFLYRATNGSSTRTTVRLLFKAKRSGKGR